MTENFYTTETFDKDHRHFGGIIYESDFNTEYCNNNIAQRIESDFRRERSLRKDQIKRQIYEKRGKQFE